MMRTLDTRCPSVVTATSSWFETRVNATEGVWKTSPEVFCGSHRKWLPQGDLPNLRRRPQKGNDYDSIDSADTGIKWRCCWLFSEFLCGFWQTWKGSLWRVCLKWRTNQAKTITKRIFSRKCRSCVRVRQFGVYKNLLKQTRSPVSPLMELIEFTLG